MDIVEVLRNGYSVAVEMGQMRDWLNARRIVPVLFQFDGAVLRLGFESGEEATAFADACDGRVLSEADARAALDVEEAAGIGERSRLHRDTGRAGHRAGSFRLRKRFAAFNRFFISSTDSPGHELVHFCRGRRRARHYSGALDRRVA